MTHWLEHLTGSQTRDGFEEIFYPGQKEGRQIALRSKHGIPVDDRTVAMFGSLAAEFDVADPKIQEYPQAQ